MISNGIFSTLTFSPRRTDILFLLQERPRTLQEINTHFHIHTTDSLPRLREMEAEDLVIRNEDYYELTWIGEAAAINYRPFIDSMAALENNKVFWKNHNISVIPKQFLGRIKDLRECEVIRSKDYKICFSHDEFVNNLINSEHVKGVTSVFNPYWVTLFTELSTTDISIDIVITKDIYEEIKLEYSNELEHLLENPKAHIYIYSGELKIALATMAVFDGTFFSLGLYNNNTEQYDNQNDLEGTDQASFKFGECLFEYFKHGAVEVPRYKCTSELGMYNQESEFAKW